MWVFIIPILFFNFATSKSKLLIKKWGQHDKYCKEIMTIAIEAQVTVYLYEQVTTHNTGVRNEIITFNQVYADKEKAMKAMKIGEVPNIEDGMPYEGMIGESFQYHEEYDRNDGDHVWEIRRETRVREEDGWTIKYEANRVIEKKF